MKVLTWGKQFENTITGERDSKLCNLLDCDGLTFNPKFKAKNRWGSNQTTFNEIKVVPYQEALDPYWFNLMGVRPDAKKKTGRAFLAGLAETMVNYAETVWDPNKFHIILHSSGIDSRILSTVLRKVYENQGEEFFGKFLFVCWGVEGKTLGLMLKTAGWNEADGISLPRYTKEYYEYNLDFKEAPRHLNGASTYPVNDLYWIIDALRSRNKIPQDMDEVEMWGAGYFNEVFKIILDSRGSGVKRFLNRYYSSFGSSMISALPCTFVPLILNPKTIEYLVRAQRNYNPVIRKVMLNNMNSPLSKIPRIKAPRQMPLPEKYALQTRRDYDASWYGQNIVPNAVEAPVIKHSGWWRLWTAAALMNHYRKSQVER